MVPKVSFWSTKKNAKSPLLLLCFSPTTRADRNRTIDSGTLVQWTALCKVNLNRVMIIVADISSCETTAPRLTYLNATTRSILKGTAGHRSSIHIDQLIMLGRIVLVGWAKQSEPAWGCARCFGPDQTVARENATWRSEQALKTKSDIFCSPS